MNKQQVVYTYPLNLLNNFNFIYPYVSVSIKSIFNFNLFNYKVIKCITTTYLNYIYLKNILKRNRVKTRSDINKSNKKPWAQKKLGRARAGSFKSPLWRGGGVVFGPTNLNKPKFKLNKKLRKLSIIYILLNKRMFIYCTYMFSIFHSFNTLDVYISKQLRMDGVLSNKVLCIMLNNMYIPNFKIYKIVPISMCDIKDILKNEYILFIL